ncbi:CBS domain-containing protein [Natronomonas marina]|jgi:CBS domain-containing protein|uniref:CBS domain-containing protein n=1 Tax=Natronomonas marina TaxID=2961939 RepID=UPI0020C979A7|nr:CBS domain-containing protein [Natronomonas marina]
MTEPDNTVEELMTAPVETVSPDATLAAAARTLNAKGIGSLVVGEDRLDGIITESDVVAAVGEELDPSTPVSALMTDPVVTIRRTETLRAAAERMGHNGVKKLPVVEDGAAIGIITTTDLALHLPNFQVNMAHQAEPDIVDGEWE